MRWQGNKTIIPDVVPMDEWDQLEVLYNARNDLAHLRKLEVNRLREVKKICDELEK